MSEIFTIERVDVQSVHDLVVWQMGSHAIKLYYQTTIEIVNATRLAAKLAMRHEGNQIPDWRDILAVVTDDEAIPSVIPLNPIYRRTEERSNIKAWAVVWEGALVVYKFDELTAKYHYTDALRVMQLLRYRAKCAKHWAGDPNRGLRVVAYLNDAEENYQHGYAT